ncbi:MAG: PH domain-containing protein [Candidatus Nanogingivalaceae bacterium]|jgi:hypothetical protein cdiviTM7_03058|nr:MAG: PH domain-containing protein [Candidatus Nanogingivalaceae bacterium]QWB91677.1 MAG: PH domain-containing protein [Candidatus Nanogingivalaceae bacterium]
MKEQIFKGQREGEEFLFMFRKHIIAMRKGFYLFLGVFAISCLPTFFMLTSENLMNALWVACGGFLVGLMLFLYHFMLWYYSIYIVSNQRIRQITQKGFFGRRMMDLPLSKIQSVNFEIPGFFGDIFHFGTINIFTIVGDLEIKNVEHPEDVYNRLQDAISKVEVEEEDEEF